MWFITLSEISVGAVVLAAWMVFVLLGLAGSVLQLAVRGGWAVLSPANHVIRLGRRRADGFVAAEAGPLGDRRWELQAWHQY